MASFSSPRLRLPPTAVCHADQSPNRLPSRNLKFPFHDAPGHNLIPRLSRVSSASASRSSSDSSSCSSLCRCRSSEPGEPSPADEGPSRPRWDALIQGVVRSAVKRWDDYVTSRRRSSWAQNGQEAKEQKKDEVAAAVAEQVENEGIGKNVSGDWDWERWSQHFAEVEEQENLLAVLKVVVVDARSVLLKESQLNDAVAREDYEDAAKLKLAITCATKNDAVGAAISDLNKALEEERYCDAAYIRDNAGVSLIGWWAGVSENNVDPYGRIICISAQHGKYLAKSFSPRQLATSKPGFPLFEVYFTFVDGEYKKQAVYLKHNEDSGENPNSISKGPEFSSLNSSDPLGKDEKGLQIEDKDSVENDSDINDGLAHIQNLLQDMIPGVRVKVLKVVSPGKVDKDLIAKVVEQIMEEEEASDEENLESVESEDAEGVNSIEQLEVDIVDTSHQEEKSEVSLSVVIDTLRPKISSDAQSESLIRRPARLEINDHSSFSLVLNKDVKTLVIDAKAHALRKKAAAQRSADLLISDIAKAIKSKEKVHMQVLKDIGELIGYAVNHKQDYHVLTGATRFSRIEITSTTDPLSGLYVGAHGMYSSNILHVRRKFGQWQQELSSHKPADLEFYEYVEAIKLTGDPSVPAGEVAFRAKVGKRYQLPHKGIIPEEFGVVARYRGQGRLADPGYQNPRWVDGELVILDGKYIRAGPVIGFVYWAPESHFLLFFNRLKLPE